MIHEVHMGMGRVTKNDINLKGNKFIGMDKRKND